MEQYHTPPLVGIRLYPTKIKAGNKRRAKDEHRFPERFPERSVRTVRCTLIYPLPHLEGEQKALEPPLDLPPRGVLRDPFSKGHSLEVLQVHLT